MFPRRKNWDSVDIDSSNADKFKKLVRKGVPNERRVEVWLWLTGAKALLDKKPTLFADALVVQYGDRPPPAEVRIPTFGGVNMLRMGAQTPDVPLDAEQLQQWRLLMLVIAAEFPEVKYCPAVPDLASLCLHVGLAADQTFAVLSLLLSKSLGSQDRQMQFVNIGDEEGTLFAMTFENLVHMKLPALHKHMAGMGMDILALAGPWFMRAFVGALPLPVTLRVVDSLLLEGVKVLYRVGLAVLRTNADDLLRTDSPAAFADRVRTSAAGCTDGDTLLKAAFGLHLKRKHARKFNTQNEGKELEAFDRLEIERPPLRAAFRRPARKGEHTTSLATDDEFDVMWSWLPDHLMMKDVQRVFATTVDGYRLDTLLERSDDPSLPGPCFLLIKPQGSQFDDASKDPSKVPLFGAFTTDRWEKHSGYFGGAESFAFAIRPRTTLFPWAGASNAAREREEAGAGESGSPPAGAASASDSTLRHFQLCMNDRMAVGAGAISLDADLHHGVSQPCPTYATSMPLGGENYGDFVVAELEVWALC